MSNDDEDNRKKYLLEPLMAIDLSDSDDDNNETVTKAAEDGEKNKNLYNGRKPKWWKTLAGRASKAQKRAMTEVMQNHRVPRVPYGSFINWEDIFPASNDIWLEIGFGRGENLLALADRKPSNISLVGAEIHQPGIGTLCQRILEGIRKKSYWNDYVLYSVDLDPFAESAKEFRIPPQISKDSCECTYSNLRIYPGDGVKLLPYIPSSSLAAVLVTFPDPFPKKVQQAWRLVQVQTLVEIHRVLLPKSGCFYLATDHEGFYEWSQTIMGLVNSEHIIFRELNPIPNRLEWMPAISKYEQKGWDEGRRTRLSCWQALS